MKRGELLTLNEVIAEFAEAVADGRMASAEGWLRTALSIRDRHLQTALLAALLEQDGREKR